MRGAATGRPPEPRADVMRAAIALADEEGVDAVTMRRLGQATGVEAMSLYNHVPNKDDVLDGDPRPARRPDRAATGGLGGGPSGSGPWRRGV